MKVAHAVGTRPSWEPIAAWNGPEPPFGERIGAVSMPAESPAPVESSEAIAAESPPPPAEPAVPSVAGLGTLLEAFRADPDGAALKAGTGRGRPPEAAGDGPAPEASAPPDGAASKSGEQAGGTAQPSGLSRRGAAKAIAEKDAEISDQKAEIDRLVAEQRAADDRDRATRERLAQVDAQRQQAQRAVLAAVGDDAEFARLQDARLRNRTLTYQEDERLDAMIAARETAQTYWELADRGHKAAIARSAARVAEQYGLDRDTVFGADLPALIGHAVAATEQRVRGEQGERIKELEKELEGLRTRAAAAGRSAPIVGGASGASGAAGRMPEDGASPLDWFKAGAREREQAAARGRR